MGEDIIVNLDRDDETVFAELVEDVSYYLAHGRRPVELVAVLDEVLEKYRPETTIVEGS